jgi:hypothetical protein
MFVFAADTHLSSTVWIDRPDIANDSFFAFEQVVDEAISRKVPLVLGGDVLDKRRPDSATMLVVCTQMQRCQDAGIPVYYVQGQHELDRQTCWLSIHPWPVHLHKKQVIIGGHKVAGIDWLPVGELQAALDEIPADTEILVCHAVWEDFMGGVGRHDGKFADVPHVRVLLTGDFHENRVEFATGKSGQAVTVVSPGSTHMRKIDEQVAKYCYLIRDHDVLPLALKTRGFVDITINTPEELAAVSSGLRGGITIGPESDPRLPPLVRVTYYDDIPEVMPRVIAAMGSEACLFWRRRSRAVTMEVEARDLPTNVVESLTSAVLVTTYDPRVQQRAAGLLNSPNPEAEQAAQYGEFMRTACSTSTPASLPTP